MLKICSLGFLFHVRLGSVGKLDLGLLDLYLNIFLYTSCCVSIKRPYAHLLSQIQLQNDVLEIYFLEAFGVVQFFIKCYSQIGMNITVRHVINSILLFIWRALLGILINLHKL